jgi:uncharacterized membrane protein
LATALKALIVLVVVAAIAAVIIALAIARIIEKDGLGSAAEMQVQNPESAA